MSNGYYSEDPGIDPTDKSTDEYLISEIMKGDEGDIYAGYFDPVEILNSGTSHPFAPGITELKMKQRQHRAFFLACRLRPRTQAEAHARMEAIQRYSPEIADGGRSSKRRPVRHLLCVAVIERGRVP